MSEYGLVSCKLVLVTKSDISIDGIVSQRIWKRRDVLWETFDSSTGVFSRSEDTGVKEA